MNLYKRDTYSEFRDNSYRYYVHTFPIERKLVTPSTEEWNPPDREQLERKYFAKLQDQGIGSILGFLLRCMVWVVCFPFYVIKYLIQQVALKVRQASNAVKQALLPPYLKIVMVYRRMKVAYAKIKLALYLRFTDYVYRWYVGAIERKIVYIQSHYHSSSQSVKVRVRGLFRKWTHWRRLQWSCFVIWLSVLWKYSMRVLEDWKIEVKQKFPNKEI